MANQDTISIVGFGSISPLGANFMDIQRAYYSAPLKHYIKEYLGSAVGAISSENQEKIYEIRQETSRYQHLDKSVLYALYAARQAIEMAQWERQLDFGINVGSSRGATELFEKYYSQFLKTGKCSPLTSPTTTLGNIASWIAQDVKNKGVAISHSITCSTALHALLNAVAWIKSSMIDKFLVGATEAPLTDFTLQQMKDLKIYGDIKDDYPCQALDINKKKNTMILGEGACMIALEKGISKRTLALVSGIGYAIEPLTHNISISVDAQCFQQTMKMAMANIDPKEIDVIITHTTGTLKGDCAEYNAIKVVFGEKIPFLTSNKWKIGHTLGASGALSIEMALMMFRKQQVIAIPYIEYSYIPKRIKYILVNAVGFGGNAVSVLLSAK